MCLPISTRLGQPSHHFGYHITMTRQRGTPAVQSDFLTALDKPDNAPQFAMDRPGLLAQLTFKMDAIQTDDPLAFRQVAESSTAPKLVRISKGVRPPNVDDNLISLWVPGAVPPAVSDANRHLSIQPGFWQLSLVRIFL
jgi:hypothetical protein